MLFFSVNFFLLKNCEKRFFPLILHFAKGSIIISENEEILKFPCFSFYLYLNVFKLYLLLKSLHFSAHSFCVFPKHNQHLPLWLVVILIFMFAYHNPDFF